MSKGFYDVVIVRPGMQFQHADYHIKGNTKHPDGSDVDPKDFSFTEIVEAKNKADAAAKMRAKYRECTIDTQATNKCG